MLIYGPSAEPPILGDSESSPSPSTRRPTVGALVPVERSSADPGSLPSESFPMETAGSVP
jgi:hypothetical protein